MRLSKYERETTINWNMAEDKLYISTRMPSMMKHIEEKLGIKPHKVHTDKYHNVYGKDYILPLRYLRLPQKPRKLSEETKLKMAQRLVNARSKRGNHEALHINNPQASKA